MKKLNIYICDDQESIRGLILNILSGIDGLSCQDFSSAEDLLSDVDERKVDLIISDMSMQGMSGYDLARTLDINGSQIPILIITGVPGDEKARAAAKLPNVKRVIAKPFKQSALIRYVCEAIDSQSMVPSC